MEISVTLFRRGGAVNRAAGLLLAKVADLWLAGMFDRAGMDNPFGHSGRRISDFWAGLNRDWGDTQSWKRFRKTAHDHNPVNDAMGNVEAFEEILRVAEGS